METLTWNTMAIIASIFLAGASSILYFEARFRKIDRALYSNLNKQATRIQRLELKIFGFTRAP